MDNIIDCRLDSTCKEIYTGIWQHDYGQILRITGVDLPKAVEVQFSLRDKGGDTLTRIGTTVDGVTEVKVPDSFLKNENCTQNYLIYAWIYVTDDASGNTEYQIILHVKSRPKPEEPSEEPLPEPNIFHETVEAVNASAERAENAASSAMESAASADETLEEIKRVADGISENIENANTMKSELSDTINSAGIEKKELESSIGKAGEAKTALDSSISSAGEKKLALDATVEQANTVDASLKEQIGSAQQIQANVEQIGKNTQAISSLNEELSDLQDKKITKFYASNQGETHLADSDNGKMQDMMIYGKSSQVTTIGKNLLKIKDATQTVRGVTIASKDGILSVQGTATETGWAYLNIATQTFADGTYIVSYKANNNNNNKPKLLLANVAGGKVIEQNVATALSNVEIAKICFVITKGETYNMTDVKIQLELGSEATAYEPYTGGIPSPNPDYPQEIKSVVNPTVEVCGKNLADIYGYSAKDIPGPEAKRVLSNEYGTTLSTTDKTDKLIVHQEIIDGANPNSYTSGYFCIGINERLEEGKKYKVSLDVEVLSNPFGAPGVGVMFNGNNHVLAKITEKRVATTALYKAYNERQYVEIRNAGMSLEISNFMITEVGETDDYEPYTEQSVQLPYTLNAIPVDSGGNITIDGQQYIADYVDVERGKYVQMIQTDKVRSDKEWKIQKQSDEYSLGHTSLYENGISTRAPGMDNTWKSNMGDSVRTWRNGFSFGRSAVFWIVPYENDGNITSDDINTWLVEHPMNIMYPLAEPIERDLAPEEIETLKALVTNYPVTNISVTSDQLDGYTVFNYPISMANGWNYVKQQLGDTREYIYDMDAKTQDIDIQSAEAYINSEYAVALTELEV